MKTSLTLALPPDFRGDDLLAFHRRDSQALAERVTAQRIDKGLLWQGRPACLSLVLESPGEAAPGRAGKRQPKAVAASEGADQVATETLGPGARVTATLAVDGGPRPAAAAVQALVSHLLGLDQPVAEFAAAHGRHPQLGPVIARLPGLRVPQTATPFEALTWAVTGQQISVAAAVSLRRQLILAADLRHSSGLYCYPDAEALARLDETDLRQAGFSRSKAATLLDLARAVAAGELDLSCPAADLPGLQAALLARRGIGPWTVNYTLLRGFAWLDGSLHGDVAVRRALGLLLGRTVEARETEAWLESFRPWRALAAAHLWASLRLQA